MSEQIPEIRTRKPTGKPPWPMILLAGGEKTGKSWAAAAFSASDLVGRTFYIEVGEHYADEYGAIPGARYEIVEHDGSYKGIGQAIWAATKQPRVDGKPNAIVVDSMTLLWDLLSGEAQRIANNRWRSKHPKAPEPDSEVQITMDLWNRAKDRWNEILGLLREHDGPVILTARLEQVTVVANGLPTTDKLLKVKAEKNLPYEVDVIVQIPAPRTFQITGLRSVRYQLEPGKAMDAPDFTVDGLLRRLGLDVEGATSPRTVTPQHQDEEQPESAAEQPRMISDGQLVALHASIAQKYGPMDDERRHAGFSKFVGRPIATAKALTYSEASGMLDALAKEPDYVKPQPEQPERPKQAADGNANFHEAEQLARLQQGREAEELEDALLDSIQSSENPAELTGSMNAVVKARDEGRISGEQFARLAEAADLRGKRGRDEVQRANGHQMAGAAA